MHDQWGTDVEDCTPTYLGPYYLDSAKDYLYFKPGSWWVYKNNLSGETDSIYTLECDSTLLSHNSKDFKWVNITYTDIKFKLKSSTYNTQYQYRMPEHNPLPVPEGSNYNYRFVLYKDLFTPPSTSRFDCISFCYPFKKDHSGFLNGRLDSIIIQGKVYRDIVIFQVKFDGTIPKPAISLPYVYDKDNYSRFYWARDYGQVLMEQQIYKKDINQYVWFKWELIKSNIIK